MPVRGEAIRKPQPGAGGDVPIQRCGVCPALRKESFLPTGRFNQGHLRVRAARLSHVSTVVWIDGRGDDAKNSYYDHQLDQVKTGITILSLFHSNLPIR